MLRTLEDRLKRDHFLDRLVSNQCMVRPCGFGSDQLSWPVPKEVHVNPCLRICKYDVGGKFEWHRDAPYTQSPLVRSIYSILVYLNDEFDGGETKFLVPTVPVVHNGLTVDEELDVVKSSARFITVKPQRGNCIMFDQRLLHAGETVRNGIKYVMRTDFLCFGSGSEPIFDTIHAKIHNLARAMFRNAQQLELNGQYDEANILYERCLSLRQAPHLLSAVPDVSLIPVDIQGSSASVSGLTMVKRDGLETTFAFTGPSHLPHITKVVQLAAMHALATQTMGVHAKLRWAGAETLDRASSSTEVFSWMLQRVGLSGCLSLAADTDFRGDRNCSSEEDTSCVLCCHPALQAPLACCGQFACLKCLRKWGRSCPFCRSAVILIRKPDSSVEVVVNNSNEARDDDNNNHERDNWSDISDDDSVLLTDDHFIELPCAALNVGSWTKTVNAAEASRSLPGFLCEYRRLNVHETGCRCGLGDDDDIGMDFSLIVDPRITFTHPQDACLHVRWTKLQPDVASGEVAMVCAGESFNHASCNCDRLRMLRNQQPVSSQTMQLRARVVVDRVAKMVVVTHVPHVVL